MISFIIRCVLAAASLFFTVALFYNGYWGWGIVLILVTAIIGFSFFRNENMILALNAMRQGDTEKAKKYINKIGEQIEHFCTTSFIIIAFSCKV